MSTETKTRSLGDLIAWAQAQRRCPICKEEECDCWQVLAAAPVLLEALRNLNAYVQKSLIPSVRAVEGGQAVLDKGWQLVSASHAALALVEKGDGA